jgi:hypothetical protein
MENYTATFKQEYCIPDTYSCVEDFVIKEFNYNGVYNSKEAEKYFNKNCIVRFIEMKVENEVICKIHLNYFDEFYFDEVLKKKLQKFCECLKEQSIGTNNLYIYKLQLLQKKNTLHLYVEDLLSVHLIVNESLIKAFNGFYTNIGINHYGEIVGNILKKTT